MECLLACTRNGYRSLSSDDLTEKCYLGKQKTKFQQDKNLQVPFCRLHVLTQCEAVDASITDHW